MGTGQGDRHRAEQPRDTVPSQFFRRPEAPLYDAEDTRVGRVPGERAELMVNWGANMLLHPVCAATSAEMPWAASFSCRSQTGQDGLGEGLLLRLDLFDGEATALHTDAEGGTLLPYVEGRAETGRCYIVGLITDAADV